MEDEIKRIVFIFLFVFNGTIFLAQCPNPITSVTLTVNDQPCGNTATGSATVTLTGGVAPFTYAWTRNGTVFTATPANAPTNLTAANAPGYVLTVTDACGSSTSNTITLANSPPLTLNSAVLGSNALCNSGNGTIVGVIQGGSSPRTLTATNTTNNTLVYSTQVPSGIVAPGQFIYTLNNIPAGTYTVSASDGLSSCVSTSNTPITVTEPVAITSSVAKTDVCFGGTNGTITVTASGGTGTLQYSIDGGTTYQASNAFTGLSANAYQVVVQDANNCTTTPAAVTINQSASALAVAVTSVTNLACNGASTGAINITVTGGYNTAYIYAWTGPGSFTATTEDLTNRPAGTYNVTVTDAGGCTATTTVTLSQPPALSVSAVKTNIYCFGGTNGTITTSATGGTPPYTYSINSTTYQSSPNFTGLAAGNYIVTVEDANNCNSNSANLNITQPAVLSISNDGITPASCVNTANGSIYTSVTGGTSPYTYAWTGPNSFTSTVQDQTSNLAPGTYAVIVTDANACTAALTALTVNSQSLINVTTVATNVTCFQGTNGAINATVTGGVSPYTFVWKKNGINFATTEDLSSIGVGSYTLDVTDANFCSGSTLSPVIISEGPQIIAAITPNGPTTFCSGGTVVLTSSASTGNAWSNGATTQSITVNQSGSYTVTASSGSCSATSTPTVVTVNPLPVVTCSPNQTICSGSPLTLTGFGASTYTWNNGVINNTPFNPTNTQTYNVTGTDINGCAGNSSVTITVNPTPNVVITSSNTLPLCPGGNTQFSTPIVTGATYQWFLGTNPIFNATNNNYTATIQGAYSVKVTNQLGCQGSSNTLNLSFIQVNLTAQGPLTFCQGSSVQIQATSGTGYTYRLIKNGLISNNIVTTPVFNIFSSGTYRVQVTTPSGCVKNTNPLFVQALTNPTATITSSGPLTFCSSSTLTLLANTSGSNVSYQWRKNGINIPGANAATYAVNQTGSYSVVIANQICPSTSATTSNVLNVTVNPTPNPNITASGLSTSPGVNVTLSTTAVAGSTYLWHKITGSTAYPISGATQNTYTTNISGAYRVKVTNSFGCSAFSSTKVISAVQYPVIGATCQDDGIFISKSYVAPNTAKWFELTEDSLVSVRQMSNSSGTKIYDKNEGAFQLIDVSNAERIIYDELTINCGPELLLFPNPTSSDFQIENLESLNGISSIQLYDSFGKLTRKFSYEESFFNIDGLSSGIYFIRIESKSSTNLLKLSIR